MKNSQRLSNTRSHNSVAVNAASLRYGAAETYPLGVPVRKPIVRPIPISRKFKFFLGELTGFMFIILSTCYIFAMPAKLASPYELKVAMGRIIKRAIDIVAATVGLIFSLPVMLVLAALIKLDSPGPVFYRQVRVGVNRRKRERRFCQQTGLTADHRTRDRRREDHFGKPFTIIKLRTMVQDAEKGIGPVWATKNDSRVTRLGAFLRKTRLDEVPQFWSILKGDMSLVGPRPERPSFVRDLSTKVEGYRERLEVKPGLTGLAQVENGYDSSIASVREKVNSDLTYIHGWSVWADVRILFKTVVVVFTGRGAC